ncbi:hypothetical protein HDU76_012364 [Blyttiomyces sp. JEL0837]|nr:hypothetical protein HDU76_012364 [Blyttiomyces sp. JEL0837]
MQQYPVNSEITLIKPYCEIDSCGRRVIRVWDSSYLMTWKEVEKLEKSDEIEGKFQRVSIFKGLHDDTLAFYNSNYLADCLDFRMFAFQKSGNLYGLKFFEHLSLALSALNALGDYWNAFRVGMIGVLFKGGINFGGQAHPLLQASLALERLGRVGEAVVCINWANSLTSQMMADDPIVTEVDQVLNQLEKEMGYYSKAYTIESLVKLLMSREFHLLDAKDGGKVAGMFDELDDDV